MLGCSGSWGCWCWVGGRTPGSQAHFATQLWVSYFNLNPCCSSKPSISPSRAILRLGSGRAFAGHCRSVLKALQRWCCHLDHATHLSHPGLGGWESLVLSPAPGDLFFQTLQPQVGFPWQMGLFASISAQLGNLLQAPALS